MEKFKSLLAQPGPVKADKCNTADPQEFPAFNEVVKGERGEVPIYGIYCWAVDYPVYRDAIRTIGFKNIRTGGRPFTDELFTQICEDGLDAVVTMGSALRNFESEEDFITGNIRLVRERLLRYGPNGSFFKEHPEVPYHPIMNIEVFNEPNFQYMVPNDTDINEKARLYSKLQVAVYRAIKPEFPDVRIVGFGAGGASAADIGFVDKCCTQNPDVYETMDVFSTHPYMDPISPFAWMGWLKYSLSKNYMSLRNILARGGKPDMPIWYTELGWFITPEAGGRFDTCQNGLDKIAHAAFNVQMYALGMRLGVERITTMYIMDTDGCNPGFVDLDGTLRPAAYATKTMIELMPDPLLKEAIIENDDNCYAYRFESAPGGEDVVMVFHANAPHDITIPWDAPTARVTDMLGTTETVAVEGGKLTLPAGPCPLYVRK